MNDTREADNLEEHYQNILKDIGENPQRDGLLKTPERAAKAMRYFCHGYGQDVHSVVSNGIFIEDHRELVVVKDIDFFSMCEHHLVPFYGHISIGYVPKGKILGLSKFARLVEVFSRRLQLQERLTTDVISAVNDCLQPHGVAVLAEATHLCMVMRGVQKMDCTTLTSAASGVFETKPELWSKFMHLVGK